MSANRPIVLSLAGFDPCGGAGILADCKTFENLQTYGLAVPTANTLQTENTFEWVQWQKITIVLESLELMLKTYDVKAIKIGIIPNYEYLLQVVCSIRKVKSNVKIIWDPVVKATTDFSFICTTDYDFFYKALVHIDLITPNFYEIDVLVPEAMATVEKGQFLSRSTAVLLKGGHNENAIGLDHLITDGSICDLKPSEKSKYSKHGSGCVLAAAVTAYLGLGMDLYDACFHAKLYVQKFLDSTPSLLGYHDR